TGSSGNKTVGTTTAGTTNPLTVGGSLSATLGNGTDIITFNQFNVTGGLTADHANGTGVVNLGVDPANLGTMFNRVGGRLNVNNVTTSGAAASGNDIDALEETNVGGSVINNLWNDDAGSGFGGWTSFGSLSGTPMAVGGSVTMTAVNGNLAFGDFFG